jgi:hypothetical protein
MKDTTIAKPEFQATATYQVSMAFLFNYKKSIIVLHGTVNVPVLPHCPTVHVLSGLLNRLVFLVVLNGTNIFLIGTNISCLKFICGILN